MLKTFKTALIVACALAASGGLARATPEGLARFDVRNSGSWAERLVLCDATAFLSARPDFNAQRMWVMRDDGHRDLLLPPDFIGAGRWYKEGYERLYWRLQRHGKVDSAALHAADESLGRPFVESYRRNSYAWGDMSFLRDQDAFCRAMAREQGEIIG